MRPTTPERGRPVLAHANAPLTPAGRLRLIQRCQSRPIAHVAAEAGVSRQCLSKWKNRYDTLGEVGLIDRSSAPHASPTSSGDRSWPGSRRCAGTGSCPPGGSSSSWPAEGITVSPATVGRWLVRLGINRRRDLDPTGESNRAAAADHRPLPRAHGPPRREEGRPDPRRRRLAGPRPRLRAAPRHRPGQDRRRPTPATSTCTPRSTGSPAWPTPKPSPTRRPPPRSGSSPAPAPSSPPTASPQAHPGRHRQRFLLPRQRVHPVAGRRRPPPADPPLHPTPQRQSRALPTHPRRGTPLRPTLDQRNRSSHSPQQSGTCTTTTIDPTPPPETKPPATRLHHHVTNVTSSYS